MCCKVFVQVVELVNNVIVLHDVLNGISKLLNIMWAEQQGQVNVVTQLPETAKQMVITRLNRNETTCRLEVHFGHNGSTTSFATNLAALIVI